RNLNGVSVNPKPGYGPSLSQISRVFSNIQILPSLVSDDF
ncbi:unnamed protein product, partial [Allacma fusca]